MSDKVIPIHRGGSGFVLWLILLVVLLGGMLYFVVGRSKIDQVVVSGSDHYSKEEIIEMMNIKPGMTIIEVFMMRNDQVNYYPYVKSAKVDYNSFSSVSILVEEKSITSYMPYQNQYLALDKDGYIVGFEDERLKQLPIISGISYEASAVGQQLIQNEYLLRILLDLYQLSRKYSFYFDEIAFINGDGSQMHIYVGAVDIIIGDGEGLDRKIRDASEVIDRLGSEEAGILDLSYESDSYVLKRALDVAYYIQYGERYLAINDQDVITGLSIHRIKDLLVIGDVQVEEISDGSELVLDETFKEAIEAIRSYASKNDLEISRIGFENGDLNSIRLWIGDVYILFGDHEEYDHKFAAIVEVLNLEEEGVSGQLDIRDYQEVYQLQKNVN